jgi:diacylglycerol kinase family enzyme
VPVVVILNPRSRANRRDPGISARLTEALAGRGRVIAPASLEEMAAEARGLAQQPPEAIAVHGGDGTLHRTLSALIGAWRGRPLPALAVLPGGTMNVVAASLMLRARPEAIVRELVEEVGAGRSLTTVERPCLRVGDAHGFVFGNGLMANFLEDYYAGESYGPGRAAWLMFRTFCSALIHGRYSRRIFRRFEGTITVDGETLPWHRLTGVGAATVREVGLGFKLNHRAQEDRARFGTLAIHAGPLALSLDLWSVHRGRGISRRRAWSGVSSIMRIEPANGEQQYTIDGDLYRCKGPLEIGMGPSVRFFKPRTSH